MYKPPPAGHNGSPTYETRADLPPDIPALDWWKCVSRDFLADILRLPLDERGFYVSAIMVMYDNMEMLPSDDRIAAGQLALDVRSYRAMKAKLLARVGGKSEQPLLYVRPSGRVSNRRYEAEIAAYVDTIKAKREAAKERERKKREDAKRLQDAEARRVFEAEYARVAAANQAQIGGDLPSIKVDTRSIEGRLGSDSPDNRPRSSGKSEQKQQNTGTALPEPGQALAESKRERESLKKERDGEPASVESEVGLCAAGLPSVVDTMVGDVTRWMHGGDDRSARKWIATTTGLYGQQVVKDGYAKLLADMATGALVANPLVTLTRICKRLSDELRAAPSQPRGWNGSRPAPALRDPMREMDAIIGRRRP